MEDECAAWVVRRYGGCKEVQLTYEKKELKDLLKRNTGKDHECGCKCVYSGSSIWLGIQFVCKKCLLPRLVEKVSLEIFRLISKKSCFVGNRFVMIGSIIFVASELIYKGKRVFIGIHDKPIVINKGFCSKALYITPPSLRERVKLVKRELLNECRNKIIVDLILSGQKTIERNEEDVKEYLYRRHKEYMHDYLKKRRNGRKGKRMRAN